MRNRTFKIRFSPSKCAIVLSKFVFTFKGSRRTFKTTNRTLGVPNPLSRFVLQQKHPLFAFEDG